MEIKTHHEIDQALCGKPLEVKDGFACIELLCTRNMAADDSGLVHGGFIFGLADYAAMIAVNHPNVVLGGADVKFLMPVCVNDKVVAKASVQPDSGKKQMVSVKIDRGKDRVFEGVFACFILDKHVLDK